MHNSSCIESLIKLTSFSLSFFTQSQNFPSKSKFAGKISIINLNVNKEKIGEKSERKSVFFLTKLELLIDWWLSDPRIWGAKQSVKLTYCRNSLEPLTKAWTQWNLKQVHLSRLVVYIHFHEKNSSNFVFILFSKYKVSSLWQIKLNFDSATWLDFILTAKNR